MDGEVRDGMPGNGGAWWRQAASMLQDFGPGRIVALGAVLLGFAVFAAFVAERAIEPRYTLLYAGLDLSASEEIVRRLETSGIPYKLSPNGDAVSVPEGRALSVRMDLAQAGLPGGDVVGYEIFDEADAFATTEFLSNVNLKRALEGELARTVASLRGVSAARVHLVQPTRRLFEREAGRATASVFLSLSGGSLGKQQIAGVRHLVASAVPGLEVADVTVLDDRGNLLARGGVEGQGFGADDNEAFRAAYEERMKRKVVSLLERSIGPNRVEAEVTAAFAFDRVETTFESYDPEGQVARSTQTVEEQSTLSDKSGGGDVTVATNLPTEDGPAGGEASNEETSRTEEIVNFEISRTVRSAASQGPRLERLSVAIQVDGVYDEGAEGAATFRTRSEDELAELEALVRAALGLSDERGDRVTLVSRRFVQPEPIEGLAEPPMFTKEDILRLIEQVGLVLVTILVLAFGVRPLLRRAFPPRREASADAPAGGSQAEGQPSGSSPNGEAVPGAAGEGATEERVNLVQVKGGVDQELLNTTLGLIDGNPDVAADVVRSWLATPKA